MPLILIRKRAHLTLHNSFTNRTHTQTHDAKKKQNEKNDGRKKEVWKAENEKKIVHLLEMFGVAVAVDF